MADILQVLTQTTSSLDRLNQNVVEMVRTTQNFIKEQSQAITTTQRYSSVIDETDSKLELLEEELERTKKGTQEQRKEYVRLTRQLMEYEKQIKQVRGVIDKGNLSTTQLTSAQTKLKNLQSLHAIKTGQLAKVSGAMSGNLTGLIKGFNILGVAITFITGLIVGQYKTTKDLINASAGFVEGLNLLDAQAKLTAQGLRYAMDPVELQKLVVANRQVVNALGGTANTLARVDAAYEEFRRGGVSSADAVKAAVESFTTLRRLGIDASSETLVKYARDVGEMGKLFGLGEAEARAYFDEITREADFIDILRRTREGEREAIIESQRAFLLNAAALGMTADQAREAAKMLNKMVAAKPLDRMKQAARARALAAAMGVGGGEEAARAIMAGSRATPEQRQQLAEFGTNIANAADAMRGAGLGSEIVATALLDKLDPENMFGSGSPFSTTLGQHLKIDREAADRRHADLKTDPFAKAIRTTDDMLVRLGIASGSLIGLLEAVKGIWDYLLNLDWDKFLAKLGELIWAPFRWWGAVFTSFAAKMLDAMSSIPGFGKVKDAANALTQWSDEQFAKVERAYGIGKGGETVTPPSVEELQRRGEERAGKLRDKEIKRQKSSDEIEKASQSSATSLQETTKRLGSVNELLTRIHENSEKQVELAEKQLAATLLTEKEKVSPRARTAFMAGNRFVSQYNGLGGLA